MNDPDKTERVDSEFGTAGKFLDKGLVVGKEVAKRLQKSDAPLGLFLVEKGMVTQEQLSACVAEQDEATEKGFRRSLGQIAVRRRYMSAEQLVEALKVQGKTLVECSQCGARFNAFGYAPEQEPKCEKCKGLLQPVKKKTATGTEMTIEGDIELAVTPTQPAGEEGLALGSRFGRYDILRSLGEGGMGMVYLARDPNLSRTVALKILKGQGKDFVERFKREARSIAQLKHPNIVGVFDIGDVSGRHYFTMEFVPGKTMGQRMKAGELPFTKAIEMLIKTARGVGYAHQHQIIHRDLKPANILVQTDGEPVITDFGLAKSISWFRPNCKSR